MDSAAVAIVNLILLHIYRNKNPRNCQIFCQPLGYNIYCVRHNIQMDTTQSSVGSAGNK